MKHILIAALLCLSCACSGLAQDSAAEAPATKEDVEKYLQAMHSHEMMQKMMDAMVKSMLQMTHDRYLKDKDKLPADFEARTNKMVEGMMKDMPFDEMTQAMVPTYQKHFTKGDMEALVIFYNSPAGQKLLREMPAITAESMTAIMPIMRQHTEAVNRKIQQQTDEMLKQP